MFEDLITWINTVSQGNEFLAGVIAASISGAAGYLLHTMPRAVLNFTRKQLITTLTLNNGGYDESRVFAELMEQLDSCVKPYGVRSLIVDSGSSYIGNSDRLKRTVVLSVGYGTHYMIYKNRLLWIRREEVDSSGSERIKNTVTLSVLGRSHKFFRNLVDDLRPKDDDDKLRVYTRSQSDWEVESEIPKVGLDSLALDMLVRELITNQIEYFLSSESDYRKLGLAYKMAMILHGAPGTGKTALIRTLACEYDLSIYTINLSLMSDTGFRKAVMEVPRNSIILVEDFDSSSATHQRSGMTTNVVKQKDETQKDLGKDKEFSFLTTSGILNTLDGVVSLDKVIIVFTTNCIDKIDEAILRPGRMDLKIELPKISNVAIQKHFTKIYGDMNLQSYPSLYAKDINKIVFEAKLDKDVAKSLLLKELQN